MRKSIKIIFNTAFVLFILSTITTFLMELFEILITSIENPVNLLFSTIGLCFLIILMVDYVASDVIRDIGEGISKFLNKEKE